MSKKRMTVAILLMLLAIIVPVSLYGYTKPLPEGFSYEGPIHYTNDVEFLKDLSYKKEDQTVVDHEILDRMLQSIHEADDFIVIDMFLFNDHEEPDQNYPSMAEKVTKAILDKKTEEPDTEIIVLTDEINRSYSSHESPHIEKLQKHGVHTGYFDNTVLRDPAPLYSGLWRSFFQWFGTGNHGWLPNAMSKELPDVTARSYLKALNLKGNHRKLLFTEKEAFVTSLNFQGRGAYNSNFAFVVKGNVIQDLLYTEKKTGEHSGIDGQVFESLSFEESATAKELAKYEVQVLTEDKIEKHLLKGINASKLGDSILVAAFYLSDRELIKAMIDAASRGVDINVILDPNLHAFGRDKPGIPNQVVAHELEAEGTENIHVRWYNTAMGEQYHTKFFMFRSPKRASVIGGAANFTKRNIDGFNLETNLKVSGDPDTPLMKEVSLYFDRLWTNKDGDFTVEANKYKDRSRLKHMLYILQERTGFSTF
ncbi:phospholipase D-like domain-containing protein [Alteribacter aurantiacus]|uniref:phospholipase D-like domain-containing protein n=1 Tax=Alteribacter aurantiacus TaxID=254410 RepID=UPI0003F52F31|nr:phospholipase D-like domain-containing protein [Alteribacter aurantiacus]